MKRVLEILDFIAKGVTVAGAVSGHPEISGLGKLIDAVIDSEHDDRDILEEIDTSKLIKLRNEIEEVLDIRTKK